MPKSYPFKPPTREEYMIAQYGECVSKTQAAKILGRSVGFVSACTKDGRLELVCEGTRVSVKSIALYMERPGQLDFAARNRKKRPHQKHWIMPQEVRANE